LEVYGEFRDDYYQLKNDYVKMSIKSDEIPITTNTIHAPNYMVDVATGVLVDAKMTMSLELLVSVVPQV